MKRTIIVISLLLVCLTCVCALFACVKNHDENLNQTYIISFNTNGGTKVPSVSLKAGSHITLPEAPTREGYVFIGWFLDDDFEQEVNPSIFKVVGSRTIFAGWESVDTFKHYITVSNDIDNGEISILSPKANENNEFRASKGTEITVDLKPFLGYEVVDGTLFAGVIPLTNVGGDKYKFIMPAESVELTAIFDVKPMKVQTLSNITNGSVVISTDQAKAGELVSVYVIPDYGFRLKELYLISSGDTQKLSILSSSSFHMGYSDTFIGAEFEEIDVTNNYKVTLASTVGGTVSLSQDKAPAGIFVNVRFIPNDGYYFKHYSVYGANALTSKVYTYEEGFIMPNENVTLNASFARIFDENAMQVNVLESQNGTVELKNERTYVEGENVELVVTPSEGYVLKNIYVNGVQILGNVFNMPSNGATVTADFIKKGYSINAIVTNCQVALSHETAYAGEYVFFKIFENDGYYVSTSNITVNDSKLDVFNNYFIMPDCNATLNVLALSSNKKYNITSASLTGGSLQLNLNSASLYNKIEVTPVANEGYRYKEGSLTVSYVDSGETVTKKMNGLTFPMIGYDIVISAEFEQVYQVLMIDDGEIGVFPSSETVALNETVWFEFSPHSDVIESSIDGKVYFGSYTETLNSAKAFTLTPEKLALAGQKPTLFIEIERYDKQAVNIIPYSIKIMSSVGGVVSVDGGQSAKKYGEYVRLNIDADSGYRLKQIVLSTNGGDVYNVSDTFIMPNSAVTLTAEFEEQVEKTFSLTSRYDESVGNFNKCGFEIVYLREKYQFIANYPVLKNNSFINYVEGVLKVSAKYGHNFYIVEINDVSRVTPISYELHNFIAMALGLSLEEIDVKINYNYIILSVGGSAREDFYVYKNGVKAIDDFIIYEREDGSYGVYAYIGRNRYVTLLDSYNGRAVTYLSSKAFANPSEICGIKLSNLKELGDFALENTAITYIDVAGVEKLGVGVFKDCKNLKAITAPSYNYNYYSASGVLFEQGNSATSSLYHYPMARSTIDGTYTLPEQTKIIAPYAFYKTTLKVVSYYGALNEIGDFAFAYSQVENIKYYLTTFASGVVDFSTDTVNKSSVAIIGDGVFIGANRLNSFYLDSIVKIGKYAIEFNGESNLVINLSERANGVILAFYQPVYIAKNTFEGALIINVPSSLKELYLNADGWRNLAEYFYFK